MSCVYPVAEYLANQHRFTLWAEDLIQMTNYREILKNHNIPLPDGEIQNANYQMKNDYWYVLIADTWYWFDNRDQVWKPTIYGPL